jgi:hypothetical protein
MAETPRKTAAKKAAPKAEPRPTVDKDAVHDAERSVADKLEAARLIRVGLAERRAERDPIWDHLARPFDADWIEKLPKQMRKDDQKKAKCEDTPAGRTVSADSHFCGGWHARSLHLDYVGHAGITMRLNEDVGPENWSLEALAVDDRGYPVKSNSEFWVRLTILGVSKIDVAENFKGMQEAWGDGLRRAAMRFGIGTALWSKSEYAFNRKVNSEEVAAAPEPEVPTADHVAALKGRLGALTPQQQTEIKGWWVAEGYPKVDAVSEEQAAAITEQIGRLEDQAKEDLLKERLGASPVDPSTTEAQATDGTARDVAGAQ